MIFENSKCRGSWLHRFEIVGDAPQGILERCNICGTKKSFRYAGGDVNPREYLSYHMRSALPKDHRLFTHEYPQYAQK